MIQVASILVDVDPAATDHPALDRAVEIAARIGARVKIVDVLPPVPNGARAFVTAAIEQELVEHRRARLTSLAAGITAVPVSTALWRGRPATALIQEVLSGGHDLLVRAHDHAAGDARRQFGAVDMELLRLCPCPVWLMGRQPSRRTPWRIAAAIHPALADETEQEMNALVLEWALLLKEIAGAEVSLLQAWSAFGASVLRSRLPAGEFAEFIEEARRAAAAAMAAFTKPFADRLNGVSVHLLHGAPEEAIAAFVEANGIDLVVMGTVARTGVPGLLIGNTAERVLQRLRGSVLTVKPPGFVTPVERS